jgi:pimeloyl-ACP methyl ester carboxylesterase
VESAKDLACYPDGKRPADFLFPPTLAAREAKALLAPFADRKLDHAEAWEARAALARAALAEVFGGLPREGKVTGKFGPPQTMDGLRTVPLLLEPEPGLALAALVRFKAGGAAKGGKAPACVLLHLDGKAKALEHPLAAALLGRGWVVYAPDLRGTGEAQPKGAVVGAPDHNSAEHAVWVGRPLLGQWVVDVRGLLAWMAAQPGLDSSRLAVAGLGQAGLVALSAAALLGERVAAAAALEAPVTWVTTAAYPAGTRMGLLAPGVLRAGDVPHLAALAAPRKLVLAGGLSAAGKALDAKGVAEAFAFTRRAYRLAKAAAALEVGAAEAGEVARRLEG